ncbi:MAG: hypothetical protein ACRC2O_14425 [Chitinophagaceae bacterium]
MIYQLPQPVVIFITFLLLMIFFYAGAWMKQKISGKASETKGVTIFIESTLLSLLLGFAYNTAANKSFARKELVIMELNSISTALARTKLYPDSIRHILIKEIGNYAISRAEYYRAGKDEDKIALKLAAGDSIGNVIIDKVSILGRDPSNAFHTLQMMPAINTMLDIASIREFQRTTRIPLESIKMLLLVSLLVSFLNGTNGKLDKVHFFGALGFSLIISMTIYLIFDLDSTREGYITLDKEEAKLEMFIKNLRKDF